MDIQTICVLGGNGKTGEPEKVERFELKMGDIISIVGPTGCGKTTLINDIELFANRNTPSNRLVMINGETIPEDFSFLKIHAKVRGGDNPEQMIGETLEFANQLTGEAIITTTGMTELSGGQTRSLLIADAVIIGNSPIILLDEIENAGIHRTKALELLKQFRKIFVFVTHDPHIALLSDYRIIMKNGSMEKLISTNTEERKVAADLGKIDNLMLNFRTYIRSGQEISENMMAEQLETLKIEN
ncbi:MAG: ATP-binding cassette domain-containing protein [Bacteroidetes bacterium]|nr:ATP-binding cassette domain-containing protein [Bacteroidota bacterium]